MSDFVPKVVGGELPPVSTGRGARPLLPKVAFALALLRANPGQWVQIDGRPKQKTADKAADLLGPWKSLAKHGAKFAQRTVGDVVNVYAMLPAEEPPAQG